MSGGLPAGFAATVGRGDQARAGGLEGRGQTRVQSLGIGRIWGRGQTAAGLATEARIGSVGANLKLDTGTISAMMLAGIVIGIFAYYFWTRSSQA